MQKLIDGLNLLVKHVLNVLLFVLIVAVFAQVIFRFVLNQPLAWTEELARYCLVWITFLGASYAMSKKAHVSVDFFKGLFSSPIQKVLSVLAAGISMVFFIIMMLQGNELVTRSMTQLSPVLRLPMGVVYSIIPISAILLTVNVISITVNELRGGQTE